MPTNTDDIFSWPDWLSDKIKPESKTLSEEDDDKLLQRDLRDIKKNFILKRNYGLTYIIIVAVQNDLSKNQTLEIPAELGTPITNEVFNYVRDSFHVLGVDYYHLGSIPVNYVMECPDTCWSVDVPLPEVTIKKYMSVSQKRKFTQWKKKYKSEEYSFRFIQQIP